MNDQETKRIQEMALFRYGVIADLLHLAPGEKSLSERLKEKAAADYSIPHSNRVRVAAETVRDWLKAHRKGGFDALMPKPRKDQGQSRALPTEVSDLLLAIKEDRRELSVQLVIKAAQASGTVPEGLVLAPTTVHRLLARAGLMQKKPDEGGSADRRRFSFAKAGELWMSDVMHGPSVTLAGGTRRKAYLIGFLDDATRVVPFGAFALSENVTAFLPVLKQAVLRRGLPKRLFVDNGAAYRSHRLALVCAKLGITLIHARAYQPESKGKQERWFRTVRMQFLPTLQPADTSSLEALNRKLWAWIEGEYHQSPHRGIDGETPLDRWAKCADEVRYLDAGQDLDDLFLAEAKRKVGKDRTVSLFGVVYEVDAALVNQTVTLRFDPGLLGRKIQVWSGGKQVQEAKVVDVYANCFVKRNNAARTLEPSVAPPAPPPGLSLADLDRSDEEEGR